MDAYKLSKFNYYVNTGSYTYVYNTLFDSFACFDYDPRSGNWKNDDLLGIKMLRFATCQYINDGRHIILKGASGNGKTYIACALGNAVCRKYKSVRYIRMPELLDELSIARANGEISKVIKNYKKVDLLILDEWLIRKLTAHESYDTCIWNTASLNYILNNERYAGDALLQKFYTTGNLPFRKEKNKGQRTMYYVQNSHAGIISKTRFDAAKSMQARRKKRNIQPHGLTKLLICQDCGHTFRQVCSDNNVYWSCSYQMSGHSDCQRIRVDEEDVIAALMRMIEILHQHCDSILIPMIKALEKLKSKENGTFHKLYEIDKTIAEINNSNFPHAKEA